jgi:DeoR/GlpR family transcriptional regulator of sugar metabolism
MALYNSTKERRAAILQELKIHPEITVNELSIFFSVSEVTIRKDLNELKKRNLLTRVRGGAIRLPDASMGGDLEIKDKQLFNYKEKRAIGKLAASLINDNETIMLDSGTTTLEIARNLQRFRNLTIVTNAINIAIELSNYKRFTVILLGGHLRDSSLSIVGPLAESTLKIFYCDKLFLGVDSFNLEKGVSTPNIEEANINQTMMSMSKETIAVFDASKFNKRSFTFIAPVEKIDTVVTDEGISTDIKNKLNSLKINLYIAKIE